MGELVHIARLIHVDMAVPAHLAERLDADGVPAPRGRSLCLVHACRPSHRDSNPQSTMTGKLNVAVHHPAGNVNGGTMATEHPLESDYEGQPRMHTSDSAALQK